MELEIKSVCVKSLLGIYIYSSFKIVYLLSHYLKKWDACATDARVARITINISGFYIIVKSVI